MISEANSNRSFKVSFFFFGPIRQERNLLVGLFLGGRFPDLKRGHSVEFKKAVECFSIHCGRRHFLWFYSDGSEEVKSSVIIRIFFIFSFFHQYFNFSAEVHKSVWF
jgi:hypothetical protein